MDPLLERLIEVHGGFDDRQQEIFHALRVNRQMFLSEPAVWRDYLRMFNWASIDRIRNTHRLGPTAR